MERMRILVQRGAAGVLLTWCLLGGTVGALRLARLALVPVLVLSGAQIIRSTILYLARAGGS